MPKDRSNHVASSERRRSRRSPYFLSHGRISSSRQSEESSAVTATENSSPHRRSRSSRRSEESSAAAAVALTKEASEWEDVRCPVCMDHPHNAVLLICSSHEKGCRPFMCDTSSRHSNCLDQYCKASKESSKESGAAAAAECSECQQQVNLSCPLCRGPVSHWIKDYDARKNMNCKVRSCTMESCEFRGAYNELRKHARAEHPTAKPMEVDPVRQRDWCRMEQQRDIGDLLSMLRSGFSSSLEDAGLGVSEEGEEEITERNVHSHGHGHSITMIFIMRSTNSIQQYLSSRSRLILVSRSVGNSSAGASSGGDGDVAGSFSEEGDDPAPSTEASHDDAEEDVDGDPSQ
ncbi:hypothetical protein PR202_gb05560 [Eleusine coracana subsp. coracana]|uniref:Uncharacterized protein n=1 Tax=Eleusine coracana subsp. coracana TaxID=191504 RepID=A0AAV5E7A8_ELECO|nr:hypothetical protein QOZ80_1BG0074970 [Eleusine coracana subsp. coracana]GJN18401.1 hypothetical protein PR202_gb05560 [Eleusine coracana subsp. coracana]